MSIEEDLTKLQITSKKERKIDDDLLLLQQSGLKNVPNHVDSASWTQSASFVRCYYKPTNSAALCCMES
jgi:hypothetical protein